MLPQRRHQQILSMLEAQGEVKIRELARQFGVSTMTIRRDLEGLEQEGLLLRTHGGAIIPAGGENELPLINKQASHQREKQEIAETALGWISPGMSLILDAGSTTAALAMRLSEKAPLTVVTTDLEIAKALSDVPDIDVFVTGGAVKGGVYRLEGEYTLHLLRAVAADIAFIGCDGFTEEFAYSNTMAQASLKQAMMSAAAQRVLLADASKFGHAAFSKVAPTLDFEAVISDADLDEMARTVLKQHGVALTPGNQTIAGDLSI